MGDKVRIDIDIVSNTIDVELHEECKTCGGHGGPCRSCCDGAKVKKIGKDDALTRVILGLLNARLSK